MNRVRGRYIVEIFGFSWQSNILTIVMELMTRGSLYDFIHTKHVPLTMLQKIRMARHCASGLSILHSNNIMHRDIKSMNILLSDDLTCKITDFGCAKLLPSDIVYATRNSGTPLWMAPEIRSGNYYGFPGDIYSLGLVLYEIFECRLPDFNQFTQQVILPQSYKFYNVIHPCVRVDPQRRPKVNDLVKELNDAIHVVMTAVYEILPDNEKQNITIEETTELTLGNLYRYLVLKEDQTSCEKLINDAIENSDNLKNQFNMNQSQGNNQQQQQQQQRNQGFNQQNFGYPNQFQQMQMGMNPYQPRVNPYPYFNPNPYQQNMNFQQQQQQQYSPFQQPRQQQQQQRNQRT